MIRTILCTAAMMLVLTANVQAQPQCQNNNTIVVASNIPSIFEGDDIGFGAADDGVATGNPAWAFVLGTLFVHGQGGYTVAVNPVTCRVLILNNTSGQLLIVDI